MKTKMTETLNEQWTSYTVILPRGPIKPIDLISITEDFGIDMPTIDSPIAFDESDDIYLVTLLMCWYRYAHTNEKHYEPIEEKAHTLLAQSKRDLSWTDKLSSSNPNLSLLRNNGTLNFLAACLDMFLERFPNCLQSKARFGSIITRYQGCSGYSNLVYLKKLIGAESVVDTLEWFFAGQIKPEIQQLVGKSEEEWNVPHSYLPYMMCLRLSEKSPFSATSNPSLHLLIHTLGTLLGSQRSQHAIMVEGTSVLHILNNAVLMYIATRRDIDLKPQFMRGDRKTEYQKQKAEFEQAQGGTQTKDMAPIDWFTSFKLRDFKFTKEDIQGIKSSLDKLSNVREGTIGEWLQRNLVEKLVVEENEEF